VRGEQKPFALGVGFMLPHQPYVARREDYAPYVGRVAMPAIPEPPVHERHPYLQHWRTITETDTVPAEEVLRARTAYYALTTRLDTLVGMVLQALESTGLAENTLIVYTSDHGDQLGERGLWWKQTFFDESAKVPLILSWPGRIPMGERRTQLVNLVDLPPTLLEAVHGPKLPFIDGTSLLAVAQDACAPWVNVTYSEYCTDGSARWDKGNAVVQRMVRADDWKLIYYHGFRPQLFNLARDPHETSDLAQVPQYQSICARLLGLLFANWNPEHIAAMLTKRREEKALLKDWWRATNPPDAHRWALKVEDNWLEDPQHAIA
jgi:choline-sulfatase